MGDSADKGLMKQIKDTNEASTIGARMCSIMFNQSLGALGSKLLN